MKKNCLNKNVSILILKYDRLVVDLMFRGKLFHNLRVMIIKARSVRVLCPLTVGNMQSMVTVRRLYNEKKSRHR